MQDESIWMKNRHDVERQINEMHQPGPCAKRDHIGEDAFDINPQQAEKRKEEVSKYDDQTDIPPGPFFAQDIPERFLWHVAIPNNEVLRESDVGPEDGERE